MEAGRDKLTFITSPSLASFGYWVEQLIAESTGKEGRGILPVEGEPFQISKFQIIKCQRCLGMTGPLCI